jgi:hypothetical protein
MTVIRTYLKLLLRAPRVLRAIDRSPDLFARRIGGPNTAIQIAGGLVSTDTAAAR